MSLDSTPPRWNGQESTGQQASGSASDSKLSSPKLTVLQDRLGSILEPLSATETQLMPPDRPQCWSIQQIVAHLLLTYRLTCTTFENRLAKGRSTRARVTFKQRLAQFTLLKLGYFPYGRLAPSAVSPAAPSVLQSGAALSAALHGELRRMDALITQAELRFGAHSHAVSHQSLGPLTAGQWRTFHLIHALHHLKQIQSILRQSSM